MAKPFIKAADTSVSVTQWRADPWRRECVPCCRAQPEMEMDNKSGCQYFVDFTVSDERCGASTHDGGYVVQKHIRLGAYCGMHQHVIAERARINFPDRPVKLVPTHGEAVPA